MYMIIFPVCMSALHTFLFQRSKMPDRIIETGVTEDFEELCGCLELNLGPLEEQLE